MTEEGGQTSEILNELAALPTAPVVDVDPNIDDIEKEHRYRASVQAHRLRYWVAGFVGVLLIAEMLGLFAIIVWQGRGHFKLNEFAFTMITNGVLLQTFFSFRTIVTHLFPNGSKDFQK